MGSPDLITRIIDSLLPSAGALAAFLTAYGLFELTEWRRREAQKKAIRQALHAELRTAEVILNSLVIRFAVGVGDMPTAIREVRWQLREVPSRDTLSGLTPEVGRGMLGRSDAELEDFLRRTGWKQRSVEVPIPLPLVEAVLSSPLAGLSLADIEKLTMLKWQAHLLETEARRMEQFVALTFTVENQAIHEVVEENHKGAMEGYRKRAGFMLDAAREVQQSLAAPRPWWSHLRRKS